MTDKREKLREKEGSIELNLETGITDKISKIFPGLGKIINFIILIVAAPLYPLKKMLEYRETETQETSKKHQD